MTATIGFRNLKTSLKEVRGGSKLISTIGFRNLTTSLNEIKEYRELVKLKENVNK
jgi:hypothetical protein